MHGGAWILLHTLVPLHPNLKAASCAKSSPKPSIMPLMNGRNRLIAAPRMMPNRVGGWYKTRGGELEDGGDVEMSSPAEYCSLSERMVTPDSAIGFEGSSDAIAKRGSRRSEFGADSSSVSMLERQWVW